MHALGCIGCCSLLFVALSKAEAGQQCQLQPGALRFDDHQECFRDPENRNGWPGRFKFMPLGDGGQAYLSLGGEVRQHYEYTRDPLFGAGVQDKAGVWLQRYTVHGDLDAGPHVRIFVQLSSALAAGRAGGPGPVDENQLALQNAFVDLNVPLRNDAVLTLRGGRQELRLGSGRLVDVREGPNVRRTFDAVRATVEMEGWRVDALVARPLRAGPGIFDDKADHGQALWGVYAAGGRDRLPFGAIDLYYLGYRNDAGVFAQGIARERRHSIGARFYGAERGWDWNWETAYQFGSFGDGKIAAWTIASETGIMLGDTPWQPRIALSANIASGDSDAADPDLGTFNPIYPRGNYFSEAAVLGPRNFVNFHPYLTVRPTKRWSLTADVNLFWRLQTRDGVYSPAGQLIRAPSGSDERFVGSAISLKSAVELASNLNFTASYTHFFAGDFIRATGPSNDINFIALTVQAKF